MICDVSPRHRLPPLPGVCPLVASICDAFRSRAALQIEIVALRHQLGILQGSVNRARLTKTDRFFWTWLSHSWPAWRSALVIVKPETVLAWQRKIVSALLDVEGFGMSTSSTPFPRWSDSLWKAGNGGFDRLAQCVRSGYAGFERPEPQLSYRVILSRIYFGPSDGACRRRDIKVR